MIHTRISSHLLFNCWTVIFPKCLEPNPWNCEARSSSASRPPSATTVAWDTPAAAWDGIADMNSHLSTTNLFSGNSSHMIAISQLCNSSLTLNFKCTIRTITQRFNWIQCRVYDLFAWLADVVVNTMNYPHLQIDHGWGRLAMIAIMGMMVQDAFAAGL